MIKCFVIEGESMRPALREGDVIVACGLKRHPRVGEVLVFRAPLDGRVVVHRVAHALDSAVVTRGDANAYADPHVIDLDQIIGVVKLAIPWLGRFLYPLRKVRPA
ncbi:MAG: signal peptidase I [Kiritimatiellae bacterium]|nr:signal peptidase I [Kiritimatiellia bacterium]